MSGPPRKRTVTLEANDVVAPEVHRLMFGLPKGDQLTFEPGEFVTFYVPKGHATITRSYSIASDPSETARFELLVKRVEGGFVSTLLCGMSPGQELRMLGPLGKFTLRDPGDRTIIFACTGTGVAPFVPMSRKLLRERPSQSVWVFFGARTEPEVLCRTDLEATADAHRTFHYVPTLSRPGPTWTGTTGHIEVPIREHFRTLSKCDLYICGVPGMVLEMMRLGDLLGCPRDRVFVERY